MELRYYKMPEGSPILPLLGQKWVQNYGNDVDYLHFHNYLEIGFCYEGQGMLVLGEDEVRFHDREFTLIPPNYPHTTISDLGTISRWEYLFVDVEGFLDQFISNSVKKEKILPCKKRGKLRSIRSSPLNIMLTASVPCRLQPARRSPSRKHPAFSRWC